MDAFFEGFQIKSLNVGLEPEEKYYCQSSVWVKSMSLISGDSLSNVDVHANAKKGTWFKNSGENRLEFIVKYLDFGVEL